jgi:4-nitrophenyl phosphatase
MASAGLINLAMKFSAIKAAVFDMDGVLWRGDEPLPGLLDTFQWLRESGIPYVLATNNSTKTQADYVQKLAHFGVPDVPPERIITSGVATVLMMKGRYPAGTAVYVFGMSGLRQTLAEAGYDVDGLDGEPPQAVVVGMNRDLTYDTLAQAALHIRNGAEFIGTNPDKTFPTPQGLVPGAGSMIAALEAATGKQATIVGKPGLPMFEMALKRIGQPAEQTLMVGDRLTTDILGGQRAGMKTALLFSGVTSPDELAAPENDCWPDVAFEGLPELLQAWAGHDWYQQRLKERRRVER